MNCEQRHREIQFDGSQCPLCEEKKNHDRTQKKCEDYAVLISHLEKNRERLTNELEQAMGLLKSRGLQSEDWQKRYRALMG